MLAGGTGPAESLVEGTPQLGLGLTYFPFSWNSNATNHPLVRRLLFSFRLIKRYDPVDVLLARETSLL